MCCPFLHITSCCILPSHRIIILFGRSHLALNLEASVFFSSCFPHSSRHPSRTFVSSTFLRAAISRAPLSSTFLTPPPFFRMFCHVLGSTSGFHPRNRVLGSSTFPGPWGSYLEVRMLTILFFMYLIDRTVFSSHDTRNQPASSNQITRLPKPMNHCTKAQSPLHLSPLISHTRYTTPLAYLSIHFFAFPDRNIVSCGWLLHLATSLVHRASPCCVIPW